MGEIFVKFDALFTYQGKQKDGEHLWASRIQEDQVAACFSHGTGMTKAAALIDAEEMIKDAIVTLLSGEVCETIVKGNPERGIKEVTLRRQRGEQKVLKIVTCNDASAVPLRIAEKNRASSLDIAEDRNEKLVTKEAVSKSIEIPLSSFKFRREEKARSLSLA